MKFGKLNELLAFASKFLIECNTFSQKSIRGILIALSGIAATLGLFIVFLLGSLTEWRNVAFYCINIPILTMFAVCFVSF